LKYVYDVEVFPNLFTATFINVETNEKHVFGVFGDKDGRAKLREFLDRPITLIGFNNLSYDGPVLYAICEKLRKEKVDKALSELFNLSQKLIDDRNRDPDIRSLRYPRGIKYKQVDLMKILNFGGRVGLKQVAVNLKWHRIQDLPLPYDHKVAQEEIKTILDYNLNDVMITLALYKSILHDKIAVREEVGKVYGVDVTNSSDSNMANVLLEKFYFQALRDKGLTFDVDQLRQMRTKRQEIVVKDCIPDNVNFKTPQLITLKNDLTNMVLRDSTTGEFSIDDNDNNDESPSRFSFKKSIRIGNKTYDLGVGGIHSRDDAGKFVSDDDYTIRDCDVGSFYPNIILNNKLIPEHINPVFLDILRRITKDRLAAKKAGEKAKSEGLKITINSIFGKMGSDTFWLEDMHQFLSVTISGQLYLLMLIEAIETAGIEVISANTDGIISKIPRVKEDEYYTICKDWEKSTGFGLEFTDYKLYVRSDVNNYITLKPDGDSKQKGRYVQKIDLSKGYKHPVVQKCVYAYYLHGAPVEDTLGDCRDILDYCISPKIGGKYSLEYRTAKEKNVLQKTNRFFVAKRGGSLVKVDKYSGKETGIMVGKQVVILNTVSQDALFDEYDVDLEFYRKEAQSFIEEVEPSVVQMTLF